MKNALIFIVIISILSLKLYGQNGVKSIQLSYKDSTNFDKHWKRFKYYFDKRDIRTLKRLSLKRVECDMSLISNRHDIEIGIHYIPVTRFLNEAYKNLEKSSYWHIEAHAVKYSHPLNLKYKRGQILKIYEAWYDNPSRNTTEGPSDGSVYAFEFVKVDGKFKFFGLRTTP